MRQASKRVPESAEKTVRDIRRATRRHHSVEEKIRIVLEGLRGEDSIAEPVAQGAASPSIRIGGDHRGEKARSNARRRRPNC